MDGSEPFLNQTKCRKQSLAGGPCSTYTFRSMWGIAGLLMRTFLAPPVASIQLSRKQLDPCAWQTLSTGLTGLKEILNLFLLCLGRFNEVITPAELALGCALWGWVLAVWCSLLLCTPLTLPLWGWGVSSSRSDLESSLSQQSVILELVWVCRVMLSVTGDPKLLLTFL